jgi:hypothetical protein
MSIVSTKIIAPRPQHSDGRWYDRQLIAVSDDGTEQKYPITAHGKVNVQRAGSYYFFHVKDEIYNTAQINNALAYCR